MCCAMRIQELHCIQTFRQWELTVREPASLMLCYRPSHRFSVVSSHARFSAASSLHFTPGSMLWPVYTSLQVQCCVQFTLHARFSAVTSLYFTPGSVLCPVYTSRQVQCCVQFILHARFSCVISRRVAVAECHTAAALCLPMQSSALVSLLSALGVSCNPLDILALVII
jgi:hypothetical protein